MTLFAIAFYLCSELLFLGVRPVTLRAELVPTTTPFVERVVAAPPGSLLRAGDVVDFRQVSPEERFRRFIGYFYVGETITLPTVRHGSSTTLIGRAIRNPAEKSLPFYLVSLGITGIALFATMLSWRKDDAAEIRYLALGLLLQALGAALYASVTPWLYCDLFLNCAAFVAFGVSGIAWALFAATFGRPLSPLRRLLTWAAFISASIYVVTWLLFVLGSLGVTIAVATSPAPIRFEPVAVSILLELTLVTAALSAKGSERARAIWVTAVIAMLVIQDALVPLLSGLIPVPAEQVLLVSGYFLTPIGLSYALFNRRLLDIGFVLNRTTIFAAVSLIIFAGFNLGEWAVGGWLGTLNRTANAALSAALVLGLGLLLRPLHDGVERVVDRVLFRARYTAERALRKFAHEAAFFNDPKSLIEAAEKTVTTCARATGVVFMREGDERFATIDVDDAALVALRAWHDRLDLHSVNSKIRGEYAFPLTVRGMLTGLMVIGEKDIGEPYAPDELDALDRLALAVGISLDGLERTGVASEDSLTWMRSIDARMNVLTDQLSMLSAAVLGSSNVNASNGAATEAKPPNV